MGEGFNNSWNFLFRPHALATIHKTTAVWALQGQIGVYYSWIGPIFRIFFSVGNPWFYRLGTIRINT
jgi:hypothetical protein